ncbi:N-acyl homoserine lactonase family protein [Burkholderia cenocepacia]|uniref:N-acyl homoserine lactonase family protein n=2 Tax=Burkholderia cenocepacia TaxID=95486 RepID=UPI0002ABB66B|nr:N-acyl homoserine lactonase family protein [Burkholderia cenocepacia]ERI25012.1 metallo-beta-lactamase domain protein [Burkholderia cenocepacia BC7]KKI82276.1 metallo-beta-lactamase [Burkholderia cenocepacia]ONR51070.1 MBL fold hydrolase [Burkholderia cenocepacia]ONR79218.1 MBL fold hydrolase [Burkholderia cenocepacia]ONS02684.1 MBL fold hydrolase [Burkholderia cenocepacia]
MALKIHPINFGNMSLDSSGLVLFREPGKQVTIPVLGFLITGGTHPVLVDTGSRNVEQYAAFGLPYEVTPEMTIEHHLAQHGLKMSDIRHIVHTHAHIDHVGMTDRFPMTTTVGISRRELEFAASGIMGPLMYTAADTKHLIDRLHTRGAIRLFDVDGTFEEEVIPGVAIRLSGAHTPGSLSVLVETDEGIANISGDIAYNLKDQLIDPILDQAAHEPTITANRAMSTLDEKRAIKRALATSRFLLPSHDAPALVSGGKIVGVMENAISNPQADVTKAANYTLLTAG